MPLRFTSPTSPDRLIEALNQLKITYRKVGTQPVQITIDIGHVNSSNATKAPLLSSHALYLLNCLVPDTVVEVLEEASSSLAFTVMGDLPATAILDIGTGLQRPRKLSYQKTEPHCIWLDELPERSRVLLRKDLIKQCNDKETSIFDFTKRFHKRSIGVIIEHDFKLANIESINLSPDCSIILNDHRPKPTDATYAALGENKSIRYFDVTKLSAGHCQRLRAIIEQRNIQSENDVVQVKCGTKEQWNLFDDLPGITLVMTLKMKHNPPRNIGDDAHNPPRNIGDDAHNPPRNIGDDAHLLLHLFRTRTQSPDHVSEPAIEDELSEPAMHEQQNPIVDLTGDDEIDKRYQPAQHQGQKITIDLTEEEAPSEDLTEDEAPSEYAKSKRRRYNMVSPFCD
jgi:hypothetical protein